MYSKISANKEKYSHNLAGEKSVVANHLHHMKVLITFKKGQSFCLSLYLVEY